MTDQVKLPEAVVHGAVPWEVSWHEALDGGLERGAAASGEARLHFEGIFFP